MRIHKEKFRLSVIAMAIAGALCSMSVYADDDEAAALKKPENSVELGIVDVSKSAAKFGEYTGLDKSGVSIIGNFNVRGGDAYTNNEDGATHRWSLYGTDIGLTSAYGGATLANQGVWNVGINFDQLTHYTTDTYQTPYLGVVGGNHFTLPSGFGLPTVTALTPAQLVALHPEEIYNNRYNTSVTAGYIFNPNWNLSFDYNHLDQSGAKLQGIASAKDASNAVTGQSTAVLPMPTDYQTDTFTLGLNWRQDKAHLSASYFGSIFTDANTGLFFQTFDGKATQEITTPPSSMFHQLNLSGGYDFTQKTKLNGNFSYGHMTQDQTFENMGTYGKGGLMNPGFVMPESSLNGSVNVSHADLRLTDQSFKNWSLATGLKYDERANNTPSYIYNFWSVGGSQGVYPNTPLSYKKEIFDMSGDYKITSDQHIRFAYEHDNTSRWCQNYGVTVGTPVAGQGNYVAGTDCVVAGTTKEDKVDATYKIKAAEGLDLRLVYGYSDRKTDSNPKALAAIFAATGGAPGANGGDYIGFYPVFDASRNEQMLKASANWQALENFSLSASGKYTKDDYTDSTYGVQNGSSWSLNLDATYTYAEKGSVFAYATQQHRQRDMTNEQTGATATVASATKISVPAYATWTNSLTDSDTSIGFGFKQGGLLGDKLQIVGDVSYTSDTTGYTTVQNYIGKTTGGLLCSDPTIMSCGSLPDVTSKITRLKLTGNYRVDKVSQISLKYIYQRMNAADYYYNAYQVASNASGVMPSNQQVGNYNVNAVFLTYIHNF